jgi:hypothetical protein
MMFDYDRRWDVVIALLLSTFLAGCGGENTELVSWREQLMLDAEPADVSTIEDAKSRIDSEPVVTFAGRVDLKSQSIGGKASTAFMVAEIMDSDHDHGLGGDSDCPFCKHKAAKAPKAAVQFVDQAGRVLPHDPARLFGIQTGDVVVIHGKGEIIDELNLLNVTADSIFVRNR